MGAYDVEGASCSMHYRGIVYAGPVAVYSFVESADIRLGEVDGFLSLKRQYGGAEDCNHLCKSDKILVCVHR